MLSLCMGDKSNESKFTGGMFGYVVTNAAVLMSIALTAGLLLPFAMCFRERWMARHTVIEGRRHEFYGSAVVLFLRTILFALVGPILIAAGAALLFGVFPDSYGNISVAGWAIVPVVTTVLFGLWMVWLSLRMKKWIIRHTRIYRNANQPSDNLLGDLIGKRL